MKGLLKVLRVGVILIFFSLLIFILLKTFYLNQPKLQPDKVVISYLKSEQNSQRKLAEKYLFPDFEKVEILSEKYPKIRITRWLQKEKEGKELVFEVKEAKIGIFNIRTANAQAVCGDGNCDFPEASVITSSFEIACPQDCGCNNNGVCEFERGENYWNCPNDCPETLENACLCEGIETERGKIYRLTGGLVSCGRKTDDPTTDICECCSCTICHFFVLAKRTIDFFFKFLILPITFLMIVISGVKFIGAGSPEKINEAKTILLAAIIGFLIAFSAWLIINSALSFIVQGKPPALPEVGKILGQAWDSVNCTPGKICTTATCGDGIVQRPNGDKVDEECEEEEKWEGFKAGASALGDSVDVDGTVGPNPIPGTTMVDENDYLASKCMWCKDCELGPYLSHVCCGNGRLDFGEVCDPTVSEADWLASPYGDIDGDRDVDSIDYSQAICYCEADCTLGANKCCNNGRLDYGEECDKSVSEADYIASPYAVDYVPPAGVDSVDYNLMINACGGDCKFTCPPSDPINKGCYDPEGTNPCQKGKYICDTNLASPTYKTVICHNVYNDPASPDFIGGDLFDYCCDDNFAELADGEIAGKPFIIVRATPADLEPTGGAALVCWAGTCSLDTAPGIPGGFKCDNVCRKVGMIAVGVGFTNPALNACVYSQHDLFSTPGGCNNDDISVISMNLSANQKENNAQSYFGMYYYSSGGQHLSTGYDKYEYYCTEYDPASWWRTDYNEVPIGSEGVCKPDPTNPQDTCAIHGFDLLDTACYCY